MNHPRNTITVFVRIALASIILFICNIKQSHSDNQGPVALLMKLEGKVELSKNGKKWRRLTRNKFLFPGYEIKTGKNGSAMLMNQKNGSVQNLDGNSHIRLNAQGAISLTGKLSEPDSSRGSILSSLNKRFKNGQLHSVVRRSISKKDIKLRTPKQITLSTDYPDLVWSNLGSNYTYLLTVDSQSWKVAASNDHLVRYKLSGIQPGTHSYSVAVLENDQIDYQPKRKKILLWMTERNRQ